MHLMLTTNIGSLASAVCKPQGRQINASQLLPKADMSIRSSPVLSFGAATLADIFGPKERGRKVRFLDKLYHLDN